MLSITRTSFFYSRRFPYLVIILYHSYYDMSILFTHFFKNILTFFATKNAPAVGAFSVMPKVPT
nr:MAG TPA: hypothetical protein [Caudoviricetes sp.]